MAGSPILDVDNDRTMIAIRVPYEMRMTAKEISGAKWDKGRKVWIAPIGSIKEASTKVPHWIPRSHRFQDAYSEALEMEAKRFELFNDEHLPQVPVTHFPAWRHQLLAYHWLRQRFANGYPYANLEMYMGTGKTKVAIDTIQNDDSIHTVLVVCPASVIDVWASEVPKHVADDNGIVVLPLNNPAVWKRAEQLKGALTSRQLALRNASSRCLIAVVNYESVWRGALGKLIEGTQWDMVICDESHKIKTHNAKASQFLGKAHNWSRYRLTLTGTPMTKGPLDIFGQFRFLSPTILGTGYTLFRHKYAIMGGYQNKQVIGYQNIEQLRDIYKQHTFVAGKDVLDLPSETHIEHPVTLEPEARKFYNELEAELIAEYKDGVFTADNALVKLLRLAQATSGIINDDDGNAVRISHAKRSALRDILEDMPENEPIVVFGRFRSDMQDIHTAAVDAGMTSTELSGVFKGLRYWQDGSKQLLAVQTQSGGLGIDLTRARYCIYYSVSFNYGDYEQSLARVHRPGQERPVTYIHLIAKGTVDRKVYTSMRQKKDIIQSIVGEWSHGK